MRGMSIDNIDKEAALLGLSLRFRYGERMHTIIVLKANCFMTTSLFSSATELIVTLVDLLIACPSIHLTSVTLTVRLTGSWHFMLSLKFTYVCSKVASCHFPLPSFGRPLFRPSKRMQALHNSWLEMYPQWKHVPCTGNLTSLLTSRLSPEWMMSMIALGRIDSQVFQKCFCIVPVCIWRVHALSREVVQLFEIGILDNLFLVGVLEGFWPGNGALCSCGGSSAPSQSCYVTPQNIH